MRSHTRFALGAVAVTAGLLAFSASTGVAAVASGSTTATTVHYYSVPTLSNLYTSSGQVVTNQNTAPALGDYVVAADNDYTGTSTSHSADVTATDHLYCLITKAPATGTCSAEIATSQGMVFADNSVQNLAAQGQTQTYQITGGTGSYQGAKGTVTVAPVANGNASDFTVTWSK